MSAKGVAASAAIDRPSSEFWLEEYKLMHAQFQKGMDLLVKIFVVYIGVHGLLLKLALDKNATPELLQLLSAVAIVVCMLMFIACFVARGIFKTLRRKRDRAAEQLRAPEDSVFGAGLWGVSLYVAFNVVALAAWIYVVTVH